MRIFQRFFRLLMDSIGGEVSPERAGGYFAQQLARAQAGQVGAHGAHFQQYLVVRERPDGRGDWYRLWRETL